MAGEHQPLRLPGGSADLEGDLSHYVGTLRIFLEKRTNARGHAEFEHYNTSSRLRLCFVRSPRVHP